MLDVWATKYNRLLRQIYFHENNYYQVYVVLFKSVISIKYSRITIYIS